MKNNFLVFLLSLFVCSANAQLNIGAPGAMRPSSFSKKEMETFKASTTYFVMREKDKAQQTKIEEVLKGIWNYNKIEVIDFDAYKKIANNANAIFFGLRSYNSNAEYVSSADLFGKYATYTKVYIQLWQNLEVKKEGHLEETIIARIETTYPWKGADALKERISIEAFEYLCKNEINIPEWNLGILKNYLQVINQCMNTNTTRWKFEGTVDKEQITKLQNETLYVNDAVLKTLDPRETESPLKSYTYKYEMINVDDLGAKILSSEKPFYYLMVYKNISEKITTVVNSKTGEFIYTQYKGMAYYFKEKDILNLLNAISK